MLKRAKNLVARQKDRVSEGALLSSMLKGVEEEL